jgi:hypothetical protein
MSKEAKNFYEFGPFRVDPDKRLLLGDNRYSPKPSRLFCCSSSTAKPSF